MAGGVAKFDLKKSPLLTELGKRRTQICDLASSRMILRHRSSTRVIFYEQFESLAYCLLTTSHTSISGVSTFDKLPSI